MVGWSTDLDFIECICGIREKKDGWELKYRFGPLLMYEGYKQKNHGIETKYRFGFAYIYIKELTEKSWDWAEVQIWIWLNINEGNGHKNDGLEPKYRFGFDWISRKEMGIKMMG